MRFAAGAEVTLVEIVAAKTLVAGDEPLLEAERIAAGILATARNLGMTLGVGLAGAIVAAVTVSHTSASVRAIAASFSAAAKVAASVSEE